MASATTGVLGYVYPLLMAGMFGVGDGIFNTQLNALLGILFKDDTVRLKREYMDQQALAQNNGQKMILELMIPTSWEGVPSGTLDPIISVVRA